MDSPLGRRIRRAAKVVLSAALTLLLLTALVRLLVSLAHQPQPFPGYNLVTPLLSTKTFLCDMQGKVVNMWASDYAAVQESYLLENGHLLRAGQLRKDERLLEGSATGGRIQEFTWDGELVWDFKLHNDSQLPHHDLTRLPGGNVLLVVWEKKTAEETLAAGRRPETVDGPWLVDSLIEIHPTGKTTGEVVWEWHVWDHLIQDWDPARANYGEVAAHPELVDINFGESYGSELSRTVLSPASEARRKNDLNTLRSIGYVGPPAPKVGPRVTPDWTHVNAVAYHAELDQIMLTVRAFSELWIIDHGTTSAEAAGHTGGKSGKGGDLLYRWGNPQAYRAGTNAEQRLFAPHGAHWIPPGCPGTGHVLVFNNGLRRPGGDYSSVDEIVLPLDLSKRYASEPGKGYGPGEAAWSFTARRKTDFSVPFMSGAQRLPGGNTLICDGMAGTIFEVTPSKEVIWRYTCATSLQSGPGGLGSPRGGSGREVLPVYRAHRYAADYPGLAGRGFRPEKSRQ
jgi:arylsulfotransferase ASST